AAPLVHDAADEPPGLRHIADVGLDGEGLAARGDAILHDLLCLRLARLVVHGDAPPLRGEAQGDGATDAARTSRDERDASLQALHGCPLSGDAAHRTTAAAASTSPRAARHTH